MTGRIDANVLLRFLTNEPVDHAERAAKLLGAVMAGEFDAYLEEVILAEVVWTLNRFYRMPRADIAAALLNLLADDHILAADKDALRLALIFFAERNVSFVDAYLAAKALQAGDPVVYSFDRDFDRIPGVRRVEP